MVSGDVTVTHGDLADAAGISVVSVHRWWQGWHGAPGYGRRRTYTTADLKLAQAWHRIPPRCRDAAHEAVHTYPDGGWLLVGPEATQAVDDPGLAAYGWACAYDRGELAGAYMLVNLTTEDS